MINVPQISSTYIIDTLLESISPYFHLYVNDACQDSTTTLASFDEANFVGYSPQAQPKWAAAIPYFFCSRAIGDSLRWVVAATSPMQFVRGYYVTDQPNGPLLWAERIGSAPIPMYNAGDAATLTPSFSLRAMEFDCQVEADGFDAVSNDRTRYRRK